MLYLECAKKYFPPFTTQFEAGRGHTGEYVGKRVSHDATSAVGGGRGGVPKKLTKNSTVLGKKEQNQLICDSDKGGRGSKNLKTYLDDHIKRKTKISM